MKVAKLINSIITFLIFSSLIIVPSDIQASNIESDNSTLEANLLRIASAAIYSELDALVDNQVRASSANGIDSALYIDGIQENVNFNQGLKEFLLSKGQKYVSYSTDIQPVTYRLEGDTAELEVKEMRNLELSTDGDMIADIETSYVQEHILKFEQKENVWILIQDIEINSFPELAISEENEDRQPVLGGRLLDPEFTQNNIYLPLIFSDIDNTINAASLDKTMRVDRNKVRNYSRKHAKDPHKIFRVFEQDCTNFVSQALEAGGWEEVAGWYQSDYVWWYDEWNQSFTWAGAHNLWWFTYNSERGSLVDWNQARLGDVMMFDFNHDYIIDHAAIVTLKPDGIPSLSYHTPERLDVTLWEFYYRSYQTYDKYPYYWAWYLN